MNSLGEVRLFSEIAQYKSVAEEERERNISAAASPLLPSLSVSLLAYLFV